MIKNKFWFTFIEIIVASTILILVSFFWVSNFYKGLEKKHFEQELHFFADISPSLEKQLGKEIFNYEIHIMTWSFYHFTVNKNPTNSQAFATFDGFTGVIQSDLTGFQHTILFERNNIFTWTGNNISFDFSQLGNYEIQSYSGSQKWNTLFLQYYTQIDTNNPIQLIWIKDEWSNSYTGITIKHSFWQNKQFFTSTWQIIEENIILTFENQTGLQMDLELTQ